MISRFDGQVPTGALVQELEALVHTAIFKPANVLVGQLPQKAADRSDAVYQPEPGEFRNGRVTVQIQRLLGYWSLSRDYDYHPGKRSGSLPGRCGLGLGIGLYSSAGSDAHAR